MRNLLLVLIAFAFIASCGEVTDAAKNAVDKTAEAAGNAADATKDAVKSAADATKDAANATKDAAGAVVDGAKEVAKDAKDAVVGKDGKEYTSNYICPMHCKDSGSDKPGKCPACEMDYKKNEHAGHSH